jgi:hypothetical protein
VLTSSSSFTPVVSSPVSSTSLSLDATLDELTAIAASEKTLQARRQELLDALDQLVEAGQAEEQMAWNDCKITRRIRKSYDYPEQIIQQRAAVKEAERLSVALGEATLKTSTFWEVRRL